MKAERGPGPGDGRDAPGARDAPFVVGYRPRQRAALRVPAGCDEVEGAVRGCSEHKPEGEGKPADLARINILFGCTVV